MFSEKLWAEYALREAGNYTSENGKHRYQKKGYRHFDHLFWFPERKNEIKSIIQKGIKSFNPVTKRLERHSFSPFIKINIKTPRYRYQFEEGHYDLETKVRPICFASHCDSLIMGYYSYALTKVYEKYIHDHNFDDVVLAYRSDLGKCNIQFAKEAFDLIKARKTCSVVALDIKGYFDHIDHKILKEKWLTILGGSKSLPDDQFFLYEVLTKYSYVLQSSLLSKYHGQLIRGEILPVTLMEDIPGTTINEKYKSLKKDQLIVVNSKPDPVTGRCKGIPQGSPMSALLSNVYLIDFDAELKKMGEEQGFIYRRYCDDILLICDTEKARELMNIVVDKISKEYFLTIQPAKADLVDFRKTGNGKIRGFRRNKKNGMISRKPANINSSNEGKYFKNLQYLGFEYNGKDIFIRSSSLSKYFWKLNYRLTKTIRMAYSPNTRGNIIYTKQILERYSYLGEWNFLNYAKNASKDEYEVGERKMKGMNSPAIRRQLRNHWKILRAELARKNLKWYSHKEKGKKRVGPRYF